MNATKSKPVPTLSCMDIIRFESFVNLVPTASGCLLWIGTKSLSTGYGIFWAQRKSLRAHRVACYLAHGQIPEGYEACHHCDTKLCVNPKHLYIGTSRDNHRDAIARGRVSRGMTHSEIMKRVACRGEKMRQVRLRYAARGVRNARYTHPETTARGEKSGMAVLQDTTVLEMRKLRKTEGLSYPKLGKRFGVSASTAFCVVTGGTWTHLPV